MARIFAIPSASTVASVGASAVVASSSLAASASYQFASNTACWIRQGMSKLVTCVAKANLVDGETLVITVNGVAVTYEFDVDGTGVTAGRTRVNVSTDTTAATVAARLRTAILAAQPALTVTDPTNGTLFVDLPLSRSLTIAENVANAGFTIATGTMQATAGTGSMYVPANAPILLTGDLGEHLGVIQDATSGKASTTRVMIL